MSNKNLITIWDVKHDFDEVSCFNIPIPEEYNYEDAKQETHIIGVTGDYATLCGLDGDDPNMG